MTSQRTILVTGASGQLGQRISELLLAGGERSLVVGSRTPARLEALVAHGAEAREVDFDRSSTLDAAFDGVGRLLIVSTDELAVPGLRQRQHRAALKAAVRHGVRHVAYTSMPNPASSAAIPFAPDHLDIEAALASSGLDFSVLRNGWYQENLLRYLPQIVASGTWFTAAGGGRIPFVSREDAAQAAANLVASAQGSGTYDIAGSPALTVDEIAACAAAALDRPIEVVHVPADRLAVELARQGIPDAVIPLVVMTEANQRAGHFDVGAGAVEAITGRRPRSIDSFLRDNATTLLSLTKR